MDVIPVSTARTGKPNRRRVMERSIRNVSAVKTMNVDQPAFNGMWDSLNVNNLERFVKAPSD